MREEKKKKKGRKMLERAKGEGEKNGKHDEGGERKREKEEEADVFGGVGKGLRRSEEVSC